MRLVPPQTQLAEAAEESRAAHSRFHEADAELQELRQRAEKDAREAAEAWDEVAALR